MTKKIIYRKPKNNLDRFIIATTYKESKNLRRSLELCKELYIEKVNFSEAKQSEMCAVACEEVAIDGLFSDKQLVQKYDFTFDYTECADEYERAVKKIYIDKKEFSPNQLRREVFSSLLQGFCGVEYNSIYFDGITKASNKGRAFRYIQDMNCRVAQYGRTMMALRLIGLYCAEDALKICPEFATFVRPMEDSKILDKQELPQNLVIGEFADEEGNAYLMWQNVDCEQSVAKAFQVKFKDKFRIYRVNPHTGQQLLIKDSADVQKILIMPGDGDLLRYQDIGEDAYLIEYALKK